MECEQSAPPGDQPRPLVFHDLGEGPLWTILSFCPLSAVAAVACTDRYLYQHCQQEWKLRDNVMQAKSCAPTPRQRLRRWAVADALASRLARESWMQMQSTTTRSSQKKTALPQHVVLQPPDEVMVHLYSQSRQANLWKGFLPCRGLHENDDDNGQEQSGWQVRLKALQPAWSQLVQSFASCYSGANGSSLDQLTRFVEDLRIVVVRVNHHDDKATTRAFPPTAHLITCTAGVALCQRPNASHPATPTTFVLRQQWVANVPVVVHLSIRAHANVLDELKVSYFCVR